MASYAQRNTDDSLAETLLTKIKTAHDTEKVRYYHNLANIYEYSNPDKGFQYVWEGLNIATKLNWAPGIRQMHEKLGFLYNSKCDYANSLKYYFMALKENEEYNGNIRNRAAIIGNIGLVYSKQDKDEKALEYFFKALRINEQHNFEKYMASNLGNIGNIYTDQGKLDTGMKYYMNALKINQKLNNKRGVGINLDEIGIVQVMKGNYKSAIDTFRVALKYDEEENEIDGVANSLGHIGNTYLQMAKADNNNKKHLGEAVSNLEKALKICEEIAFLEGVIDFSKDLSESHHLLGDNAKAYTYYQKYAATRDSVNTTESKIKVANLETEREKELKDKQLEIDKLAVEKKRNERKYFFAGIGLLGVVTSVVVRTNRKQKTANKALQTEKVKSDGLTKNLQDSLQQKDVLMKEIHHRVKNNLTVIGTLLDLQLDNISDEGARKAMTEGMTRVKSISLIHQQLYMNEDITTIEFSRFAKELQHQVTSIFKQPGQEVALTNEIPETFLDIDTAVPLGLILNELLTNSFKYAFGGNGNGDVTIKLSAHTDHYELRYKDSGPGLPEAQSIKRSSLGMMVMESLSKQLGGTFSYDRSSKTFIIIFKDIMERKKVA